MLELFGIFFRVSGQILGLFSFFAFGVIQLFGGGGSVGVVAPLLRDDRCALKDGGDF